MHVSVNKQERMGGKITFKDILAKSSWQNVEKEIINNYPDYKNNILGFKKVYFELFNLVPIENKDQLYINIEENYEGSKIYYEVFGKQENDKTKYALEFTRWEKWLDFYVPEKVFEKFTEDEIIVHCLWEITWLGFDQAIIQEQINDLMKRAEEVEKGNVELKKWEDVKKDIFGDYS